MELRVIDISEGTSVDGPGLRTSIYFSGCTHKCPGCHNPQSWDYESGRATTIDELLDIIRYNGFNVTFTGGDPFYQHEEITKLARRIKDELHLNIWCYTGYLWEDIVNDERFLPLLQTIDVLVDSPFILSERNTELRFRGSNNQRIIDVKKSLSSGKLHVMTIYDAIV